MSMRTKRVLVWLGQHGIRHRIANIYRVKMIELIELW